MDGKEQEEGGAPRLSVIISTCNRRGVLLTQCLPSIFRQDLAREQYEVIVIVDGATDGTGAALRQLDPPCALRIVEQPNRGLSKARNTGIAMARGELVMFLDDDFICEPEVFRLHVEAHQGAEAAVVHGAIYLGEGSPPTLLTNANRAWYRRYNDRLAAHGGAIWPGGVFLISNSSMARAIFLAHGGLDEELPAMDDFEFGLRLWKQGVRFTYLPNAVCYELSVKGWRSFLFDDGVAFGRTAVLLSRKYPEYRLSSPLLSGMGRTPWLRRGLRRIAMQSPLSPAHVLTPFIRFCDKLCWLPAMQRLGLLLLEIGRRLTEFRGALKEAGSWRNLQREFAVRLPVLLYHHVGPQQPGTHRSLTVSPAKFERQIRWLARRGFRGICPADWQQWRSTGAGLPKRPVLITFDDGYADLAQHALPVLRRYGFGAAVFVVTGQLGGTNAWDEARGSGTHRLMSAEEIREWAAQGIEFGAHTRTHADLTTLSAPEIEQEVAGSRHDLEQVLGRRVTSFAYPYGFFTDGVVDCVREAFDLALGIRPRERGINHLLTDPHRLQRTMVQPDDTVLDLACRVTLGFSPMATLRARVRLRTRLRRAKQAIRAPQGS